MDCGPPWNFQPVAVSLVWVTCTPETAWLQQAPDSLGLPSDYETVNGQHA